MTKGGNELSKEWITIHYYHYYVCDRVVIILAGEEVDSIFTNSEKIINIKWLDD